MSAMNKFRFEKREKQSAFRTLIITAVSVLLALVCCGILIFSVGSKPLKVYETMLTQVFLSPTGIKNMLRSSLPLMFCGLGVALTFKMNLNNIGAEGQYAAGVIAGGAFVLFGPDIEGVPGMIITALCCFLGGAIWALICAIPKAYWGVNESITTLMMNYIALMILAYLCLGPWKMPRQNTGMTERIPRSMDIPEIMIGDIQISVGVFIGIIVAALIYCAYKYTTGGYQLTVISKSPKSAQYAGISIKKNILMVMSLSGGLAGLAGFMQYAGVAHRIVENMPNNAGYTAIVIAYLSRLNPFTVVVVSILFGGLQNSTAYVQSLGVPSQIATMMQGVIMIFVIAGDFFQRYRLVIAKEGKA